MNATASIEHLSREKRSKEIVVPVKVPKKKLKKKDQPKKNIDDDLVQYEYEDVDEARLYNGVIKGTRRGMLDNIEFFDMISDENKLQAIEPSTSTVRGRLGNIDHFTEENIIGKFGIPDAGFKELVKIGCNFGEIYVYPNAHVHHTILSMVTSIYALKGKNIKIGCHCMPQLLDIEMVYDLYTSVKQMHGLIIEILDKRMFSPINSCVTLSKTRIERVERAILDLEVFKICSDEDMSEVRHIFTEFSNDAELFINYINAVLRIKQMFDDLRASCTCVHAVAEKAVKRKRKPKAKRESKRKQQGSGLYFSSQVTFEIYNFSNERVSKIKLFRNGNFQIPGVKKPDMTDLMQPLNTICAYLNTVGLSGGTIHIDYMLSVMRNYTTKANAGNGVLQLSRLEQIFYQEKALPLAPLPIMVQRQIEMMMPGLLEHPSLMINVFSFYGCNFHAISEINSNFERYPGLLVKFNRPIPGKHNKKLTIKMLSSGKINFDGCNSELEVLDIYHWLRYIFTKYWDDIIYNPDGGLVISSDSDSYVSIYDDML
jgi:hypothetical protein